MGGRYCATRKAGRFLLLLHPSSSLIEQLGFDRSQRMTARAHPPPPGVHAICPYGKGHSARVNARIFAIERAKWRHCCNRQSRVVVRPLTVADLADLAESDTQLSVFRALPGNRLG